ncbi:MAG: MerC domain-containing protein [Phycisphaeraceae bacterium]
MFDRLGISVSLLCAVHCLAAPFLLLALPAAGAVWSHPLVHWGLALFVLPLALWVVFNGYKRHRQRWTLVAAGLGASLIVAGLILPMTNGSPLLSTTLPWLGEGGAAIAGNAPISPAADATACSETCCPSVTQDAATGSATLAIPPGGLVTLIGSLLLVFAHLTNLVGCRRLA